MKRLLNTGPFSADLAALLLRLMIGGLFIYHGYDALSHYTLYLSMSKSTIGLGANFEFNLVVFSQFLCGIFVAFGFFTRLTIIPIFITMIVAFFIAHKGQPFMQKELPFVYWLLCIPVFVLGSGKYSVDKFIQKKS